MVLYFLESQFQTPPCILCVQNLCFYEKTIFKNYFIFSQKKIATTMDLTEFLAAKSDTLQQTTTLLDNLNQVLSQWSQQIERYTVSRGDVAYGQG